jgi:hypothetical protein
VGARRNPAPAPSEAGIPPPEASSSPVVYQLRIWLRGISPMIWRRLLVRSDSTIEDLHYTLQIVMGWTDTHLNQFRIHGKDYGVAHLGGIAFTDAPAQVRLDSFGFRPREKFLYEYDFHDFWQHEIRVERILPLEDTQSYPVCIAGHRASPPEDCGGRRAFFERCREIPGEMRRCLEQLAEDLTARNADSLRDRLEHLAALRPWLDLERFDRRKVNQRLRRYAQGERLELFAEFLD